jgi:predicted secreted hydrolase
MSTNLIDTVGETAASVLDGLAEAVLGPASSLRDGTEHAGVELPRDLYAHAGAQTEWWYYTGHLQTDAGRRLPAHSGHVPTGLRVPQLHCAFTGGVPGPPSL